MTNQEQLEKEHITLLQMTILDDSGKKAGYGLVVYDDKDRMNINYKIEVESNFRNVNLTDKDTIDRFVDVFNNPEMAVLHINSGDEILTNIADLIINKHKIEFRKIILVDE